MAAPEGYDMLTECDVECSADCLSIRNEVSLAVLESCHVNRCKCYYSTVEVDLCTPECASSCMLVPGGLEDILSCV